MEIFDGRKIDGIGLPFRNEVHYDSNPLAAETLSALLLSKCRPLDKGIKHWLPNEAVVSSKFVKT
jgi:hypothetical protein